MTKAIITPLDTGDVVELARDSRIFRKEVLRVGSINYKGQKLEFTPDYLDGLQMAYTEGAFDSVPLVFTDEKNSHTQDVERIRGEIIGFERNGVRLDAIVRASNDQAATLLRENPKIGVSCRIEQPLDRADGKTWPAAIQHVLVTANPKVTGMSPWQPVDLAADGVPVIDLSTYDFADGEVEEITMPEKTAPLTDAENARLRELLASLEAANAGAEDDGYVLPTDEELQQLADDLFVDDSAEVKAPVAALAAENEALELAQAQLDSQAIELARMRTERDKERYSADVALLATDFGIPPRITELARPLLTGTHVVELASGGQVDTRATVLKVLKAIGSQIKMLDLSAEAPVFEDAQRQASAQADAEKRQADTKSYASQFGLI